MDVLRGLDGRQPIQGLQGDDRTGYCPECGRAWETTPIVNDGAPDWVGWWPWLLVAVAIYLLVTYGLRTWGSVLVPGIKPAFGPLANCWMSGSGEYYTSCDPTTARTGTTLGLVWCVVGIGRVMPRIRGWKRQCFGRKIPVALGSDSGGHRASPDRGILALAEATCHSLFLLFVILVSYIGLSRLVAGIPLSEHLVIQAVDRALEVVALAVVALEDFP